MTIAVDFDGTIVEHRYPAIGKERPFATATLRQLMADGHKLLLWSVREGETLQEAIDWCKERGVRFYAANTFLDEDDGESIDTMDKNPSFSRKLKVDCFIDECSSTTRAGGRASRPWRTMPGPWAWGCPRASSCRESRPAWRPGRNTRRQRA